MRRGGRGFQQHDMQTPEDIFNMFFGGGPGMRARRQARQQQPRAEEQSPLMQFAHLAPLILLFIISFINLSGGGGTPSVALHKTPEMPVSMTSAQRNLKYFVSLDVKRKVREVHGYRAKLDSEADNAHYQRMTLECRNQREANQREAQRIMYKLGRKGRSRANALQRKEPEACKQLREVFNRRG